LREIFRNGGAQYTSQRKKISRGQVGEGVEGRTSKGSSLWVRRKGEGRKKPARGGKFKAERERWVSDGKQGWMRTALVGQKWKKGVSQKKQQKCARPGPTRGLRTKEKILETGEGGANKNNSRMACTPRGRTLVGKPETKRRNLTSPALSGNTWESGGVG